MKPVVTLVEYRGERVSAEETPHEPMPMAGERVEFSLQTVDVFLDEATLEGCSPDLLARVQCAMVDAIEKQIATAMGVDPPRTTFLVTAPNGQLYAVTAETS